MNRRGFSLPELLTVAFLTTIMWLLVSTLLFPVFRSIAKNSNRSALYRNFTQFLRRLENDLTSAAPAGLLFSAGKDWTLGLVLRIPPIDNSTAWSKDLLLYRYDPAERKLYQAIVSNSPMLDGGPPPLLEAAPLFARAKVESTLAFVTRADWPGLKSPCRIELQPPDGGDTLQATLHSESLLNTP
jgi:hypothetical protein